MDEASADRYWCHVCSRMVNPHMEAEIKCPLCEGGFIEEMSNSSPRANRESDTDFGSDRPLSLWVPILMGMMNNPRRRSRWRGLGEDDENGEDGEDGEDDENGENDNDEGIDARYEGETELDQELRWLIERRRRGSATLLQMLQQIRNRVTEAELENSEGERDRGREGVILIDPFNRTIIVQGSYDPNQSQNQNHSPVGSLDDYFIGQELDLLLQHLSDNDPNKYGTPPTKKEAVEAMPTVKIDKVDRCSVCLEDFEIGSEAKEIPCKHKFHGECIKPWLELHSSCPLCRYQLPADEPKFNSNGSSTETINVNGEDDDGSERRFSISWPFNGWFSSSGSSETSNGNS